MIVTKNNFVGRHLSNSNYGLLSQIIEVLPALPDVLKLHHVFLLYGHQNFSET